MNRFPFVPAIASPGDSGRRLADDVRASRVVPSVPAAASLAAAGPFPVAGPPGG